MDTSNLVIPTVIEKTTGGHRAYDIYSRLLEDRIVFIGDVIESNSANLIIAQLLYLSSKDANKEINVYINSPGGSVSDALAILDTMNHVKPDIRTICVGLAASAGAVLLSSGTKGKRLALPNSEIMIHQPLVAGAGLKGQTTDLQIETNQILKLRTRLNKILAKNTGRGVDEIAESVERNKYMTASEAKSFGIVDKILPA